MKTGPLMDPAPMEFEAQGNSPICNRNQPSNNSEVPMTEKTLEAMGRTIGELVRADIAKARTKLETKLRRNKVEMKRLDKKIQATGEQIDGLKTEVNRLKGMIANGRLDG